MSNEISNISDEIHGKVDAVVSTFNLFRGPLVYVRLDNSLDSIDVDAQFELFKVVFFEYFDDSIKKIKGLEALGARITHNLGFTYYSVSEYELEEIYKFHWQNLVWFDSVPGDDRIWDFESYYHYVLEEDEKKIEDFSKECENLVMLTFEDVKNKFEDFKSDILKGISNKTTYKPGENKISRSTSEWFSEKPHSVDDTNMIKNEFSMQDPDKGWKYFFSNEKDLKIVTDLLLDFFIRNISRTLPTPIDTLPRTNTAFYKKLRSIHAAFKKSQGIIAKDKDFENFCRSNFLPCKKIPENLFSKRLCQ